jgi:2-polyprenyl-3-methyl-5-hydroxy-6-metoxy-1,4-benzoquinol methylase
VGCADGALFREAGDLVKFGVGVDLEGADNWPAGPYERRTGRLTDLVDHEVFDAVVMLAVVEHVSIEELQEWATALPDLLRPSGRLIVTTPSPFVDHILHAGIRLKVLDGMEAHQHHGFDPADVPTIFSSPALRLRHYQRFELRLNHLFVFDRAS